ncbi:MAG TPA: aminotransferase class V-fold PLP-dependent enzyme [Pseudomonadales bacterium]|nr:aminotransferase class V-fold PLP-dependent enzyme [Pseudomonadales bacterium]
MINWQTEFELQPDLIYLNHAAVAPWPKRARLAVQQFAEENSHFGAARYENWLKKEHALRLKLKQLINAESSEEIAFQKNTSEGLSTIAYGLHWNPGDEIIISDEEFPSNRIVWESLEQQYGVIVKKIPLQQNAPEQSLLAAFSPRTRLLAISSVQYGSGIKVNLQTLGAACRNTNVLFCVDAIQSLGAHAVDVQSAHIDFLVADGHKWMLGPEGIAVFYCRKSRLDLLQVRQFGWHMIEHIGDYARQDWAVARSARRFECGSPNMLGIYALDASLSLILDVGLSQIEQSIAKLIAQFETQLLALPGISLLTPQSAEQRAGIITFKHSHIDPEMLFSALKAQNMVCAMRGGGIRFSPHFYQRPELVEQAVSAVEKVIHSHP